MYESLCVKVFVAPAKLIGQFCRESELLAGFFLAGFGCLPVANLARLVLRKVSDTIQVFNHSSELLTLMGGNLFSESCL